MAITFFKAFDMNGKIKHRLIFFLNIANQVFVQQRLDNYFLEPRWNRKLRYQFHEDVSNIRYQHWVLTFFERLISNGSKKHVLVAKFYKIFNTSSKDLGSKFAKDKPSNGLSKAMTSVLLSLLSLTSLVRVSLILLLKHDPKSFANSKSYVQSWTIGKLDSTSNDVWREDNHDD